MGAVVDGITLMASSDEMMTAPAFDSLLAAIAAVTMCADVCCYA
eukprot:COSAG01_NODE_51961_length_350_cov_1.023904_1_plen_43_part_10